MRADRFRHPVAHDCPRGGEFVNLSNGELGQDRVEALFDLLRAEPSQDADDVTCLAVRRRQLASRGVSQFDSDSSEMQPSAAIRGEGKFRGQAQ